MSDVNQKGTLTECAKLLPGAERVGPAPIGDLRVMFCPRCLGGYQVGYEHHCPATGVSPEGDKPQLSPAGDTTLPIGSAHICHGSPCETPGACLLAGCAREPRDENLTSSLPTTHPIVKAWARGETDVGGCIAALERECFALAARQCEAPAMDEHGHFYCNRPARGDVSSSIEYHQQRGRDADIIDEALAAYDSYLSDDSDPKSTFIKIMSRMRERRAMAERPVAGGESSGMNTFKVKT